ncbi:MAG TPA: orotidine-5'-phosphate decarboxylase [Thermomicrobiales bacterium]|nr:orotidine-5'-phosphate decarboxylase [Thermomicrobiales bacterium]
MSDSDTFAARVRAAATRNNSLVCVGLDPDLTRFPASLRARYERNPAGAIAAFNLAIIEATSDLVCAYKPNLGFYLAHGVAGIEALARTRAAIPDTVPAILDAKVNDIGHTAAAYAVGYFTQFGFDAITASPYLGADSLAPLFAHAGRGVLIVCRTSNPHAGDLQDLPVAATSGAATGPLYTAVARKIATWTEQFGAAGNCGAVVGATYPAELAAVRAILPSAPLLIPGIGEQGGALAVTVRAGADAGGYGAIISASRSVTYASTGADFATAARGATEALRSTINNERLAVSAK